MLISKKPLLFDTDLLGMGACVLIGVLTWLAGWLPLQARENHVRQQQQQVTQDIQQARTESEQLQTRAASWQQWTRRLQSFSDPHLQQQGMEKVIQQVDTLCRQSAVNLQEIAPLPPRTPSASATIHSLRIKVSGSFPQFLGLMAGITEQIDNARVASFTITRQHQTGAYVCDMEFILDVFSRPTA